MSSLSESEDDDVDDDISKVDNDDSLKVEVDEVVESEELDDSDMPLDDEDESSAITFCVNRISLNPRSRSATVFQYRSDIVESLGFVTLTSTEKKPAATDIQQTKKTSAGSSASDSLFRTGDAGAQSCRNLKTKFTNRFSSYFSLFFRVYLSVKSTVNLVCRNSLLYTGRTGTSIPYLFIFVSFVLRRGSGRHTVCRCHDNSIDFLNHAESTASGLDVTVGGVGVVTGGAIS